MDYSKLLNEEQLKPVNALEGPVLVLAGAGSGKTRVLTYRIANLIEHGVSPYSILAITFTNKAAKEMENRILKVTGFGGLTVSTFHSFCAHILRADIEALGVYTKNFTIYDEEDSNKVITRIIKEYKLDNNDAKGLAKEAKGHISYAKNYGHDPMSYRKVVRNVPNGDLIIRIYEDYQQVLHQNNALDFDDLLMITLQLFTQRKDVLEKYQERYHYIHVDEFQDTNKIQYTLLRLLASKYQNVFVVGDDDQSIYSWRGADYTNIKKFKEQFLGCQIFKLERNYRSTKSIIEIANRVIRNNKERMGKTLWTEASEGVKVSCKSAYDEKEEADYVIEQVMGLMRYNGYSYKDFAILVRTSSITRSFEDKLHLYNIPYRMIGGHKFFERKEVKDFLAYLKIVANPKDNESLLRIINVPKRGIGDGAIEQLQYECDKNEMSLFEGIRQLDKLDIKGPAKARLETFAVVVEELVNKRFLSLEDYADYVDEVTGLTAMYDKNIEEDENRIENIQDLIASIKEFKKDNPNGTLDEYLQSVTLVTSEDNPENQESNLLTLATVHGVKGLEFKCVFVVGLEKGLFPIVKADSSPSELEEERRIMYVAITRAMERLYLTYAQSRFRFGSKMSNTASQFLLETGLLKKKLEEYNDDEFIPKKKSNILSIGRKLISQSPAFAKSSTASTGVKDASKFKVGMKIRHARFGEGEIISISGENGDIKFNGIGIKKFNLRLAPIEIIEG